MPTTHTLPADPATFGPADFKRLSVLPGWEVAKAYGLEYDGDYDPITHGGTFHNVTEWEGWGYASCVELYPHDNYRRHLPDEPLLFVAAVTVNKPDADKLATGLKHAGIESAGTLAEASSCKGYYGSEPDDHTPVRTYKIAEWPHEWRLWKSIHPHLPALAGK